jgi:hypothetical protein
MYALAWKDFETLYVRRINSEDLIGKRSDEKRMVTYVASG